MDLISWTTAHVVALQSHLAKVGSGPLWIALARMSAVLAKYAGLPEFFANLLKAYRSLSPDKLAAALESETGVLSFFPAEI